MLTETEKVDRLLSNDTEFYLRSIDGPGIDAAAAPFRAQIQSLGAKLAQEAGAAQVIADLLELAWETGSSQGIAESAAAFDAGWLAGSGRREESLTRVEDLAAEVAETIEDMSRFEQTAAKLEERITKAGPCLHLV